MIKNIVYISFILISLLILLYFNSKNHEHYTEDNNANYYNEKVILITGSSKGIGLEIAKKLANYNTKIIVTGKTEKTIKSAVELLSKKMKI